MGVGEIESNIFEENKRIDGTCTNHANLIPESASDIIYNSIVKIRINKTLFGTGFFMKIKTNEKLKNFLLTCNHLINEQNIKSKDIIEISFGKINKENHFQIKLDINERKIITFKPPIDITLIEILDLDNIPEDKYLFPDYNYKNGYDYYKDKNLYMAGYPMIDPSKSERAICSGKIIKINNKDNEFSHSLDSRACSSGSPICLIDNKCVVGIHKQGDNILPINYGSFIGYILDNIEKKPFNEGKEKLKDEEHCFHFSNLKIIDSIQNNQKIKNVITYENKENKTNIIIVKSISEISIYDLKTRKFLFKIILKVLKAEDEEYIGSKDKLEVVNKIYYYKYKYNFEKSDILIITNEYMILINLDKNEGKILENIEEKYEKFLKKEIKKKQEINIMEYLSNLDVFIQTFTRDENKDIKNKYFYFFRNNKLHQKYEDNSWDPYLIQKTYEINGKFLITYFYARGGSTTSIYDMNNKYKKVYEKRYQHYDNYFFIKDKYIILPYDDDFDYGPEIPEFTKVNLQTFECNKINFKVFGIIKHRFCKKKYLIDSNSGWFIVEEDEKNNFSIKEEIGYDTNDNNIFYGKELLFLSNNIIISWNIDENNINFLMY